MPPGFRVIRSEGVLAVRFKSWLMCLLLWPVIGDGALRLDAASPERIDLREHLTVLADPEGSMNLADVRNRAASFQALGPGVGLNFSYVRGAMWLRLDLASTASEDAEWQLELDYASLDQAALHDASGLVQYGGDRVPFEERATQHRNPVFVLSVPAKSTRSFYLRVQSEGSLTVNPVLWRPSAFARHSEQGYALHSFYFGMLAALAAYNLLLGLALRERVFLLYVLFVSGVGIGIASIYGLAIQFLWPGSVEWGNRALVAGFALAGIVGPLFTRDFLGTARFAPRWHRALAIGAVAHVAVLLFGLLAPLKAAMQVMSVSTLLNCVLLLGCGVACLWRGVHGARLFVLSFALLLIGGMLMALRNFGLLPTHFVTLHAMQIGSALEMLLLSFALADRFNQIRRERAAAQAELVASLQHHERELEQRVMERTEALAQANARLRDLAMRDPLTALANRAALYVRLADAMQRLSSPKSPVTVLMIDLDGFKAVNDRLGHEAGDRVLVTIADRLFATVRAEDLVARLGGDEFIVVAEGLTPERDVPHLADRLLETVSAPLDFAPDARVGASIGVALGCHRDEQVDALLRRADRAMYAAKAAGRGAIRWAEGDADQAVSVPGVDTRNRSG